MCYKVLGCITVAPRNLSRDVVFTLSYLHWARN